MNSPRRCAVRSTLVRGAALALLLSLAPFAAADTAATRERRAAEPTAARPVPAQSERPASPAIVRALERVKAEPVPVGEVYALVTVTDRATGERRYVTRGEPRPEYAEYLRFPERAPAGESYAESDDILVDAETEVATRRITRYTRTTALDLPDDAAEKEAELRARNSNGPLSFRIDQDLRQAIASGAIDLASSEPVQVRIRLKNVPTLALPRAKDMVTGGLLWAGLDLAAERQRALIERKRLVAELQRPVMQAVREAGGNVVLGSWMTGSVQAFVPASLITALAERPDVFSIERVEPQVEMESIEGDDYYAATRMEHFDPGHLGQHGEIGKHDYSGRVVIGQSEECFDEGNAAWHSGATGSFDRHAAYDCDHWYGCTGPGGVEDCEDASCSSVTQCHGTRVAQLMAADYMASQETSLSAADRRRLTGTCPRCRLLFMQDEGLDQRTNALDQACEFNVDIFQSSVGGTSLSCDGRGDYTDEVESLIDCDAVYVQSAGNNGSTSGDCTTAFPADHPWTFTVAGFHSGTPCDTAGAYFTADCPFDTDSSMGGRGAENDFTIIDMTAPFHLGNLIYPDTSPPTWDARNGTSYSCPLVAGLMAEVMDWYKTHYYNALFYNNRMRTFMLLFGDRSAGSDGTIQLSGYYDIRWGAGRVGLIPFDDLDNYSVHRGSQSIAANESWDLSFNIPDSAANFKLVVWHKARDYSDEPLIAIRLTPVGCDSPPVSSATYDNKALAGYFSRDSMDGCTHVNARITNMKHGSSGGRLFHYAAYAVSGNERDF